MNIIPKEELFNGFRDGISISAQNKLKSIINLLYENDTINYYAVILTRQLLARYIIISDDAEYINRLLPFMEKYIDKFVLYYKDSYDPVAEGLVAASAMFVISNDDMFLNIKIN